MRTLKRGMGAVVIVIALLLTDCTLDPLIAINMHPFITMAKGVTTCIEKANKLYAIDDSMVFWQREGDCMDAAYGYILYGRDPGIVLCSKMDSEAGSGRICACPDSTFSLLFCTMINNLNDTKLGLSSAHSVIRVYF